MGTSGLTCEQVDEQELDARYLAGGLSEPDAEAFESHFFGCERCWQLVQQGLAIQAAQEPPEEAGRFAAPARAGGRSWPVPVALRWGLAAAAVLLFAGIGISRLRPAGEITGGEDVFRGNAEMLALRAGVTGRAITAAWPRVANAEIYRVRLYRGDGTLAAEQESTDTTISLILDSLPLRELKEAFWEVRAMDDLRNPIGRSPLTKAVLPPLSR